MKILMTSVFFHPHIGGIETVTENLANEFIRMKHEVVVVTTTPSDNALKEFPFIVLRNPSPSLLYKYYKWCDVFVHQGISLKWVWPLFLKRKPWFIVIHQVYFQPGILGKIKKFCFHFAHGIAVSNTSAQGHQLKNITVIHNSFDDTIYKRINTQPRKDFIFVGRISKSKGCFLLLDAFQLFKNRTHSSFKLTFVGDSIERESIENYAKTLACASDISFVGFRYANEIVDLLNQHKCQIVPTDGILMEAFGVVALEGLSSGCVVIGSDGDGIAEALAGNGLLYKKNNVKDLSDKLEQVANMTSEEVNAMYLKGQKRVKELSLRNVATKYIEEFEKYIH